MTEVTDKRHPPGTNHESQVSRPPWLLSRTLFSAGQAVTTDIDRSVDDDSLIRDGIAKQNLDVIVLRMWDFVPAAHSLAISKRSNFRLSVPFQSPRGYRPVYLSAGIDYKEIRHVFAATRMWGARDERRNCKSLVLPEDMRFLDCDSESTSSIAMPASQISYAALSYAWGPPRVGKAKATDDPDAIPPTIEDAMKVARALGLRYLWVDKYCIEERSKHMMISQMDRIYKAAAVTIVAATGKDPYHGIPGVSRLRHHTYLEDSAEKDSNGCQGDHIIIENPATELEASHWSTRGWTYQEGLLSPRCLIFTPTQWVFTKGHVSYREQEPVFHDWNPFPRPSQSSELYIFDVINDYVTRDLTYPSDSLRAFLGILNDWQSPTWSHLSGIPFGGAIILNGFPPSNLVPFLHGLFWGCLRSNLTRVASIPSWTWAGWRGFNKQDVPFANFDPLDWIDTRLRTKVMKKAFLSPQFE